jgi:hypothetical protein
MEALLAGDYQLSLNASQKHSAFQQLQVASGLSPFRVAGNLAFGRRRVFTSCDHQGGLCRVANQNG